MNNALQLQSEFEQAREGIIDQFKEYRKRPLTEHLKEFRQYLLDIDTMPVGDWLRVRIVGKKRRRMKRLRE